MIIKNLLFFIVSTGLSGVISGQSTFSRTYNDTFNLSGSSSRPVEGNDHEYFLATCGFGASLPEGSYQRILKVSENGSVLQKVFSHTSQRQFYSFPQLVRTRDNHLVLASARTPKGVPSGASQLFVIKLSMDLQDTIWSYYHTDSLNYDNVKGVLELENGNIAVCGVRNYPNDPVNAMDAIIFSLNSSGILRFFNVYNGGRYDVLNRNLAETSDNGMMVSGNSNSPNNPNRAYVIKVDSAGNQVWVKYYSQMSSAYISKYDDNKFILSGYYVADGSRPWLNRPKLLFIDSTGAVIKNNTYTYMQPAYNYVGRKVSDGGIVCVGITTNEEENNAGYILKTDQDGGMLWQRRYNHSADVDYFIDFIETSDHGLLISGAADDGSCCGGQNAWLVKLDSMGCLEPNCWVGLEDVEENELGIKLFPNPASDWLNFQLPAGNKGISLEIFSVSGKLMLKTELNAPLEAIQVSHLPAGLYLVKFTDGDGNSSTRRLLVAR